MKIRNLLLLVPLLAGCTTGPIDPVASTFEAKAAEGDERRAEEEAAAANNLDVARRLRGYQPTIYTFPAVDTAEKLVAACKEVCGVDDVQCPELAEFKWTERGSYGEEIDHIIRISKLLENSTIYRHEGENGIAHFSCTEP